MEEYLDLKKILEKVILTKINYKRKVKQREFRIEKVIRKKGDKLYVKQKSYNDSFNTWIDEKDFFM